MSKRNLLSDLTIIWVVGIILVLVTLEDFSISQSGSDKADRGLKFSGGDFNFRYSSRDWILPTMPISIVGGLMVLGSSISIFILCKESIEDNLRGR
jgi:hypothetical protein